MPEEMRGSVEQDAQRLKAYQGPRYASDSSIVSFQPWISEGGAWSGRAQRGANTTADVSSGGAIRYTARDFGLSSEKSEDQICFF